MMISSEFNRDASGFHIPNDLKMIAEKVAELLGKDVIVQAKQKAELKGAQVVINGDGSVSINAPSGKILG
jgi:hypothetical protein